VVVQPRGIGERGKRWSLGIGLMAVPLVAMGHYSAALVIILINRLMDGLDGAIGRRGDASAFGGYLDIFCDMMFYAAILAGFAPAGPANALPATLLLATFICIGTSLLGRAIIAAQRGEVDDRARGQRPFFHSGGLIIGSETIIALVVFCLLPLAFPWLTTIFAVFCLWAAAMRIWNARKEN